MGHLKRHLHPHSCPHLLSLLLPPTPTPTMGEKTEASTDGRCSSVNYLRAPGTSEKQRQTQGGKEIGSLVSSDFIFPTDTFAWLKFTMHVYYLVGDSVHTSMTWAGPWWQRSP